MYTYEIISFSLCTRPDFAQTIEMLDKAFANHPHLEGLIFYSDHGHESELKTTDQLMEAIAEYIEYYNTQCIQNQIKRLDSLPSEKSNLIICLNFCSKFGALHVCALVKDMI